MGALPEKGIMKIIEISIKDFMTNFISYKLRVPGVARVKFEARKMYLIWLKIYMRN